MNHKLWIYFSILFLFILETSQAQSITAVVYDQSTQEPLPYATVGIVGKSISTVTNSEGKFVLGQENTERTDRLIINYMGYEPYQVSILQVPEKIYMKPAVIKLSEVAVRSRELSAREIIDQIRVHFTQNHPIPDQRQRIFLHEFDRSVFPPKNRLIVTKSEFEELQPKVIEGLFDKLPDEFVIYQDAIVDLYHSDKTYKMIPVDGISLQEESVQTLKKEMQHEFKAISEKINHSNEDEDTYYKFKTGIFSFDMDEPSDSASMDTTALFNNTEMVRSRIVDYWNTYATVESKNWEFVNKPGKYHYKLDQITIMNEELVYQVSFHPKNGGLFEGTIYCSTSTFGVLQVDYAYAPDKSNENIHLLGIGHSLDEKKVRVLYNHQSEGYLVKYINAYQHEKLSVERSFGLLKKEKRFLWDKTLNELSMKLDFSLNMDEQMELLVLDNEPLTSEEFSQIQEPKRFEYRKELVNSEEIWKNQTILAPSSELEKYQRKDMTP